MRFADQRYHDKRAAAAAPRDPALRARGQLAAFAVFEAYKRAVAKESPCTASP